jgi:hypothetical protein
MPSSIRVLQVGNAIGVVNAVKVVAVHEEGCFGTGGSEMVRDGAEVDVWT